MASAKYFSKDLLAINQIIKGDNAALAGILDEQVLAIVFGQNAVETFEGTCALDLVTRLAARFYPAIRLVNQTDNHEKTQELKELAKSINPEITFAESGKESVGIVLGQTPPVEIEAKLIFVGSDNWLAKVSSSLPQSFSNSLNPFGAGVSGCIGLARAFKHVFNLSSQAEPDALFSTFDFSNSGGKDFSVSDTYLNDVVLVGAGAIGNGCIWALSQMHDLNGSIAIVDHEAVALSNLQRYILCTESDLGKSKSALMSSFLNQDELTVTPFNGSYREYLRFRGNWDIKVLAAAVDNQRDRILMQSTLPEICLNAYTEPNILGVSRHLDFEREACLACGYIPDEKTKNYTQQVADDCNIPAFHNLVKDYINLNAAVGTVFAPNTVSLLDLISQANQLSRDKLNGFNEKRVREFYSEFVCGGVSLALTNEQNKIVANVDAPLAFQSAMAGILLAVEIIAQAKNFKRNSIKQTTQFYPLQPLGPGNPHNFYVQKDPTSRCICRDNVFLSVYREKWSNR